MVIEVSAHVFIPRPRADVFAAAAGKTGDIQKYFSGFPPLIPPIVDAWLEGGEPPREGATRHVKMGDGSHIIERILAFEAPSLHRYEMVKPNPIQKLLCARMTAEWRFEEQGSGTRLTWHYAIEPRPFRGPLPRLVGFLLHKAMQRCLDNLAAALR